MSRSYLVSLFLSTTTCAHFQRDLTITDVESCYGRTSFYALERMSLEEQTLAFEHLLSLQDEILAVPGWDNELGAQPRLQYCRALLRTLLQMKDIDVCLKALARMNETLHPSLVEIEVRAGKCWALGFHSDSGALDGCLLESGEARRLLSALALFGRIPRPWHDALVSETLFLIEQTYAWISYPLSDIPESFWLWAETFCNDDQMGKIVARLVLFLCLNHDIAREVIRRALLTRLLLEVLDPANRITDDAEHWPGYDRWLFFYSHDVRKILGIIACLEIPEFDMDLQILVVEAAMEFRLLETSTSYLHEVLLCNPKLKGLMLRNPNLWVPPPKAQRDARCGASVCACFGRRLITTTRLEYPSELIDAPEENRKRSKWKRRALYQFKECMKSSLLLHDFILSDSMVRCLNNVSLSSGLTLAHILVLNRAHVWWLGVAKRAGVDFNVRDKNGILPMFQDGSYSFMLPSQLNRYGLQLALERGVKITVKDLINFHCTRRHDLFATQYAFGSSYALFRLAEDGFFTDDDIAQLYFEDWVMQHEMPLDRCRALWLTGLRFPDCKRAIARGFLRLGDQPRTSTHNGLGRIRPRLMTFLFRASLLVSIVNMQERTDAGRSTMAKNPIVLLHRDILTKLVVEHYLPLADNTPIMIMRKDAEGPPGKD